MAMRKPHFLMFTEGDPDDKGQTSGGSGNASGSDKDHGFPKDTPLVEMTTEQQLAYWKFHARQHEGVAKSRADYDQQKAAADAWRKYQEDNKAPDQKVVDQAAEQARLEERTKLAPRLVAAEFKALAAGDIPKELLDGFLEDVDYTKYLDANGDIDTAKVQKRVDALKPAKGNPQQRKSNHQGYRPADGATSVAVGRDLYASRHNKNQKG
jgi:hypothetical protein